MRRKPGSILPTERAVLEAGLALHAAGTADFYGYALAREMQDGAGARRLVAHGTLYKALDRLQAAGFLESRWEEPEQAQAENRPRRRLYRVTVAGTKALALQPAELPAAVAVRFEQEPAS